MEFYCVYLRAYIHARNNEARRSGATNGMDAKHLAAASLAIYDVTHSREPKTIDALLATINGMCTEAVATCV